MSHHDNLLNVVVLTDGFLWRVYQSDNAKLFSLYFCNQIYPRMCVGFVHKLRHSDEVIKILKLANSTPGKLEKL